MLLRGLEANIPAGATLLDIGGGVGVLHHELLDRGVSRAWEVDADVARSGMWSTCSRRYSMAHELRPTVMRTVAGLAPLAIAIAACEPRAPYAEVEIIAHNYAFTAPATLPPGPTAFRLINQGTVNHEVQLFRFAAGISAAREAEGRHPLT